MDNGGKIIPGDGGDKITPKPVPVQTPQYKGFFGFSFGKSDPERYWYFKHVAGNGHALKLADNDNGTGNGSYQQERAVYYMTVILQDYGMNQSRFETKYRRENYTISNIPELKDRIT